MPADSRTLDDEGVVIAPTRLDRRRARASSPASMRNPRQREADLRAQLAADRAGARAGRGAGRALRPRRRCAPAIARDARLRRAPHARRGSPSSTDGEREARDVLEAADGDLELRLTAHGRRATR